MKTELKQEELTELKQVQRNVTGTDYIKVTDIPALHRDFSDQTVSESLGAVMKFFKNIADWHELETLLTLNFRLVNSHSISF
ncbi:MAG: hypothetical protein LBU37_01790 [Tannerellaceae bacterium]|jgi:hypothetical protein|nr:hypothetical protein [Tannerellaceae bacterium]